MIRSQKFIDTYTDTQGIVVTTKDSRYEISRDLQPLLSYIKVVIDHIDELKDKIEIFSHHQDLDIQESVNACIDKSANNQIHTELPTR